jgi:hypothetical protein
LFAKTQEVATDIAKLDVTTAVGDATKINMGELFGKGLDFSKLSQDHNSDVTIAGMTRIDLDGDVIELVDGHKEDDTVKINQELMNYHKANVDLGVESWNRFFRNLVEITATIAAIIDPKSDRVELVRALKTNLEPIGKSPEPKDSDE